LDKIPLITKLASYKRVERSGCAESFNVLYVVLIILHPCPDFSPFRNRVHAWIN
jgi:hypothetical protein